MLTTTQVPVLETSDIQATVPRPCPSPYRGEYISERPSRALKTAIEVLDDSERHIFEARRLIDPPRGLDERAIEYSISRERVRQTEARAFQKVQSATHFACARRQHSSTDHRLNGSYGSICAAQTSCVQREGA
jgi:hypothetical protein